MTELTEGVTSRSNTGRYAEGQHNDRHQTRMLSYLSSMALRSADQAASDSASVSVLD